jgi:hypothetical protein
MTGNLLDCLTFGFLPARYPDPKATRYTDYQNNYHGKLAHLSTTTNWQSGIYLP